MIMPWRTAQPKSFRLLSRRRSPGIKGERIFTARAWNKSNPSPFARSLAAPPPLSYGPMVMIILIIIIILLLCDGGRSKEVNFESLYAFVELYIVFGQAPHHHPSQTHSTTPLPPGATVRNAVVVVYVHDHGSRRYAAYIILLLCYIRLYNMAWLMDFRDTPRRQQT